MFRRLSKILAEAVRLTTQGAQWTIFFILTFWAQLGTTYNGGQI